MTKAAFAHRPRLPRGARIGLIAGGSIAVAMWLSYRWRPPRMPAASEDLAVQMRLELARRPRLFGGGIALAVGLLCGLIGQNDWHAVQLFIHRGSFGVTDPEFGYDIGFFVFAVPFYRWIVSWL